MPRPILYDQGKVDKLVDQILDRTARKEELLLLRGRLRLGTLYNKYKNDQIKYDEHLDQMNPGLLESHGAMRRFLLQRRLRRLESQERRAGNLS
jgi:hypothetical protein